MARQEPRCCARVSEPPHYQCSRRGKLYSDSKVYCHQHFPDNVARRDEERSARQRVKSLAYRRETAEREACAGITTEALEGGVVGEMQKALETIFRETSNGNICSIARTALARLEKK